MQTKVQSRPDLFLLISLLSVILIYPALDHGDLRRLTLGVLMFVPVILATIRLSHIKGWAWPSIMSMSGAFGSAVLSTFFPWPALVAVKWVVLAAFFGITVAGLFSYLMNARLVSHKQLFTAISIYLLLGMLFFTLYSAVEVIHPGSFQCANLAAVVRPNELLYFSLITLSTVGYGDIVPVHGTARMLAALEGMTGVLYTAITIALLVSSYKKPDSPS